MLDTLRMGVGLGIDRGIEIIGNGWKLFCILYKIRERLDLYSLQRIISSIYNRQARTLYYFSSTICYIPRYVSFRISVLFTL